MGIVRTHFIPFSGMSLYELVVVQLGRREVNVPGSSLSALRLIRGPSPSFGAATNVRFCMKLVLLTPPLTFRNRGNTLERSSRGSMVYMF